MNRSDVTVHACAQQASMEKTALDEVISCWFRQLRDAS